jgi:molybdopterin converting factor small subunit
VRGVEPEAQSAAKIAAERAGMTIGAWVTRALHERAAQELTGKTVGATLEKTIEQLAEQVAEANHRMAEQATQAAEAQQALTARLDALERAQLAPRGLLALFRRTAA